VSDYSLDDLLYLMKRLRDPQDGCLWDRQQTFASIVPHTLEEAYELVDAIDRGDLSQIKDELGDVLFQVIFYAQLGSEQGEFTFNEVVNNLVEKLLRRHPHVFPDGSLKSRVGEQAVATEQVAQSWETIKAGERKAKEQYSVLDDVPISLPAMTRSAKLQKRAAKVGFDWDDINEVIKKLHEELAEIQEARELQDQQAIESEVGDLLMCCVNLARYLKVDPEVALRSSNSKFERRFYFIEKELKANGLTPEEATLEQMDRLWDEAKKAGL
jgi:ATP diphosphatase